MDFQKWLSEWFCANGSATMEEIAQHLDDNYFELGYIDSFGFIMLINAIEEEFNISFDNDTFQDRAFSTLSGLARAVEEEYKG